MVDIKPSTNLMLIVLISVLLVISFVFVNNNNKKIDDVENFLENSGLSCEFVRHDNQLTGDDFCAQNNYRFCLNTIGQVQDSFFSSEDGTCSGVKSKDFDTRLFNCKEKIPESYYHGLESQKAVCLQGGGMNADYFSVLLNSGSICCNYVLKS